MISCKNLFLQTFLILSSTVFAQNGESEIQGCVDPLAAIMETLGCIELKDVPCASAGYNESYMKLHNSVDTNTVIDSDGSFWSNTLSILSFSFSYDYTANIGPNRASIRYVKDVTSTDGSNFGLPASAEYPWSSTILQYEHAIVTVDDDCKMILWDQYGDNEEQDAVNVVSFAVLQELCTAGIMPPPMCAGFGIIVADPTPTSPTPVGNNQPKASKSPKTPKSSKRA
jgi:hypothetical protein